MFIFFRFETYFAFRVLAPQVCCVSTEICQNQIGILGLFFSRFTLIRLLLITECSIDFHSISENHCRFVLLRCFQDFTHLRRSLQYTFKSCDTFFFVSVRTFFILYEFLFLPLCHRHLRSLIVQSFVVTCFCFPLSHVSLVVVVVVYRVSRVCPDKTKSEQNSVRGALRVYTGEELRPLFGGRPHSRFRAACLSSHRTRIRTIDSNAKYTIKLVSGPEHTANPAHYSFVYSLATSR